jgi:hypothetical protein
MNIRWSGLLFLVTIYASLVSTVIYSARGQSYDNHCLASAYTETRMVYLECLTEVEYADVSAAAKLTGVKNARKIDRYTLVVNYAAYDSAQEIVDLLQRGLRWDIVSRIFLWD